MRTASKGRIKCVIFDLGGVVFSSPIGRLGKLERIYGIPHNVLNGYIAKSTAWKELEKGTLSANDFMSGSYDKELESQIHQKNKNVDPRLQTVSGKLIMETIASADSWTPRPPYVEAISALRASGLKAVALTNNFKGFPEKTEGSGAFRNMDWVSSFGSLFDIVVESSKLNMRKPSVEIYEYTCAQAQVRPHECVFLDDIGANLKPAKEMGMHTIRVSVSDEDGIQGLLSLEKIVEISPLFSSLRPTSS